MVDGDWLTGFRTVRQVPADRVQHTQLASLLQHHNCHRRELLRERAEAEFGLRRVGHFIFYAGQTVALANNDSLVPRNKDRAAEVAALDYGAQVLVNLGCEVLCVAWSKTKEPCCAYKRNAAQTFVNILPHILRQPAS